MAAGSASSSSGPAITWLLPVKDGMPYLPETLASIAGQTYPHARVLAWDNGSTDGSRDVLNRWIGQGKAIAGEVVTDRPTTLGASLARMVELADTEWCARIDADDINEPNRLAQQVAWLQKHPDVALVGTGMTLMSHDGRITGVLPAEVTDHADVRWHLRFGNAISHPTVMFRRSAVLSVGNYRDIAPGQDFDLWCRLASAFRIANIPDLLVRYRVHDRSVTARSANRAAEVVEQILTDNLALLWPGFSVDEWRRMRDLLGQRAYMPVTLSDCLRLRAVATRAAKAAGEPPSYFRRTRRYRHRAANLRTRWAKQRAAVRPIWPALRALRHAVIRPAAPTTTSFTHVTPVQAGAGATR